VKDADHIIVMDEGCIVEEGDHDSLVAQDGIYGEMYRRQHLAAELVGRFQMERKGLPSLAFTVDTSSLTAVGNDYGYEDVFRRQVEALVREGDVVVGISTSGNSGNVLSALAEAREHGAVTVAFTGGDGGRMKSEGLADHVLVVPGKGSARIQEGHILVGHVLCDLVERAVGTDG
jgi:D-sedoheptulose 7-phosphate isomerase